MFFLSLSISGDNHSSPVLRDFMLMKQTKPWKGNNERGKEAEEVSSEHKN